MRVAVAQFFSDDNAMLFTSGFVNDVMFSHNGAGEPKSYVLSSSSGNDIWGEDAD